MPNVDIKKYEDFVSNSPYGSFTQSSLWAKAKVDWDSELVAVYDNDGNIKAAMQILFKNCLLSIPLLPIPQEVLYATATTRKL